MAYHVVVGLEGQGTARTDVLTFPFQLANHREHGIAILSQLQEIEDEAVGSVCHLRLTVGIRLTGCLISKCHTLKAYYSTFEWTLIQIIMIIRRTRYGHLIIYQYWC